ncbi:MAG TPA: peptidase S8, partial [Clostridiales bacterium]|nr:peptidase S8 [Clostridiales bacterium]
ATLVYDPILDSTQGLEYCQSNIDVKFGSYDEKKERDINKRNILNPIGREGAQNLFIESLYSKRLMRGNESDFALRERLLIQYADKYYPVKKYAVDLSELSEANKQRFLTPNKQWYLFLGGLFREHTEHRARLEQTIPSQEFCLIITIRDPKHMANVYDEVTQGLDLFNFWHSNIKLSSDISIPI